MTRRRAFWPGQTGQSVPPGFLGDGDGDRREPAVRWRAVEHPLYPDDVEHGPDPAVDDEPDDFAPYDRYGRFDDAYRFDDLGGIDDGYTGDGYTGDGYDGDGYEDGLDHYELTGRSGDAAGPVDLPAPPAPVAPAASAVVDEHGAGGVYRFDDLADEVGTDPTVPSDDAPGGRRLRRRKRENDAGSVLRDILVDRDDYRVEPRPRPGKRASWRLALAERLVTAWPGQTGEGAPPGFPASGELVLHPPPTPTPASGGTLVHLPLRGRRLGDDLDDLDDIDEPGIGDPDRDRDAPSSDRGGDDDDQPDRPVRRRSLVTAGPFGDRGSQDEGSGSADGLERTGRRVRRRAGRPSPRSLQRVAMAVYAALADPIANADPETRERRTLQVRRFGVLAGSAALAVVLIYAIFPVRTYLEQRAATQRAREQLDKLGEANVEMEERKEELRDDETVEEIARRDYQLVFPGEESYGLLPPPVAPTTTTTAPEG